MANEILKASVKSLISEYGTADAERIAARIGWGVERLAAWLCRHGFEDDADVRAVCRDLCENGFRG